MPLTGELLDEVDGFLAPTSAGDLILAGILTTQVPRDGMEDLGLVVDRENHGSRGCHGASTLYGDAARRGLVYLARTV